MRVLKQIADWGVARPRWQQLALRKLVDNPTYGANDIAEITKACKEEHGLGESSALLPPIEPLEAIEGVGTVAARSAPLLREVKELRNVNALHRDQSLPIATNGLTVAYGDNAAGKTGYVRVIKQSCRARGAREIVHPNLYKEGTEATSATLIYELDGLLRRVDWTPGSEGPRELSDISVFDSRSASVYVTGQNDVAYLPQGMDLFPRLVRVVEDVKLALEAEMSRLNAERDRFESIPSDTRVGEVLATLFLPQAREKIEQFASLTPDEARELERLRNETRRNRSEDPAARARELRLRAARLQGVADRYDVVRHTLGADAISQLRVARDKLKTARQAAVLASEDAFSDAPIQGVGSDTWKALWEAARRFATADANPKHVFPPESSDALCVLCQQPLGQDAWTRMRRFEVFIQGETRAQVREAEEAVRSASSPIERLVLPSIVDDTTLPELDTLDVPLAAALPAAIRDLSEVRDAVLKAQSDGEWGSVPTFEERVSQPLRDLIEHTRRQADVFAAAADPLSAQATENALRQMEARVELGQVRERALRQVEREQTANKLRKCIAAANTASITKYNTELLTEAVTQPLGDEFLKQAKALNLTHLPLAVQASHGEKGKAFHRLTLASKRPAAIPMEEVLSEGEHRCTALAAFFAEVSLQRSGSTLVFDDPVSSMDHGRMQYVARQIVSIAATRPVLVFTHELVFLWMLQGAAEEKGVALSPRYFRRDSNGAGLVSEEFPWRGQKITVRIDQLRQDVAELRRLFTSDRPAYEKGLRDYYGRLRDCWERAVEEVLFNGVVRRFSPEVQTLKLKNIHLITEAQMQQFEAGMTKTSRWQHDQPTALGLIFPEPDELLADLNTFHEWVKVIKKQHDT
jgi:recombinational DNA repair ATPase RecF